MRRILGKTIGRTGSAARGAMGSMDKALLGLGSSSMRSSGSRGLRGHASGSMGLKRGAMIAGGGAVGGAFLFGRGRGTGHGVTAQRTSLYGSGRTPGQYY